MGLLPVETVAEYTGETLAFKKCIDLKRDREAASLHDCRIKPPPLDPPASEAFDAVSKCWLPSTCHPSPAPDKPAGKHL